MKSVAQSQVLISRLTGEVDTSTPNLRLPEQAYRSYRSLCVILTLMCDSMCRKRFGIRGGGRPGGSTEPVTDTNSILQHRHGDVGMNWIPELVAGLRDIAIIVFLGYGLKLMKQQNELLER